MKLIPYKKLLTMAKEKVEESLAPIRALQMKKQGELEVAKLEEKLITLDQKIQEQASKYPVDFSKLCDALDEKALTERKIKQLQQVVEQMFPG